MPISRVRSATGYARTLSSPISASPPPRAAKATGSSSVNRRGATFSQGRLHRPEPRRRQQGIEGLHAKLAELLRAGLLTEVQPGSNWEVVRVGRSCSVRLGSEPEFGVGRQGPSLPVG